MKAYLLDTNIVSTLAPRRDAAASVDDRIAAWIRRASDELYLSWITVLELETGVLKLARTAPGAFQRHMASWFDGLVANFDDRLLPVDGPVVRLAAKLADDNAVRGLKPGIADILIAATALHHGLVLLTRNTRHFDVEGLETADPHAALPE